MATVTSLTKTRIEELLSGYEGVSLSQDEINALVIQLNTSVQDSAAAMEQFHTVDKPHFEESVAASVNAVSDLNENALPNLQAALDQTTTEVQNLRDIDVASLQTAVENTITNVSERPNVYVQDEPPENPDQDDRDLVVGDSWFDSNDNNRQRIWNGVEWSTFNVDVADFSLTVKSLISGKHQIY